MQREKIKKAKLKDLAEYLGVSVSAVKQYDKKKKLLMLVGLHYLKCRVETEKFVSTKKKVNNENRF